MIRRLILALAVVVVASGPALATHIAPWYAADASTCDGTPQAFTPFNIYILAQLGADAAVNGITGAEFRVDGFDPAWFTTVTPSPASNLALGNPIAGGCNIAFPACQTSTTVPLYTIQCLALTPIGTRTFDVRQHSMPSNVNFPCPLVTLCDAAFSKLCVSGGSACANRAQTCCILSVESTSWGHVKSLYTSGR